jgi:hypothetical protein
MEVWRFGGSLLLEVVEVMSCAALSTEVRGGLVLSTGGAGSCGGWAPFAEGGKSDLCATLVC